MPSLDDAIGGVPVDPLDAAIDGVDQDNARLRTSLYGAVKQNPDEAARALQLSRKTGLPAPLVQRNLPQVEQRTTLDDLDAAIDRDSAVGRKMTETEFAALAHDDVGTLSGIENLLKPPPVPSLASGFGQASQELRRSQDAQRAKLDAFFRPRSTVSASRGPEATLSSVLAGQADVLPNTLDRIREGLRLEFADTFGLDEMAADAMRRRDRIDFRESLQTPEFDSTLGRWVYGGAANIQRVAPSIAAGVFTRNPYVGLAGMGAQVQPETYGKYRARSATPGEAAAGSGIETAIEIGTELLPMGFLVDRFGKAGAKDFIAGYLGRELPTELVAEISQGAVDTAIANPSKTWGEWAAELPDTIGQTVVSTLMMSGGLTAANEAARRLAPEQNQADAAQQDADALAQLAQLAAASKLRTRDPQTFQEFAEAAAPGAELYLDARTLQQSGVDVAALAQASPAVAAQLEEALATGGDLVIPKAEYLTAIAGTDLDPVLTPHLRASEEALSLDESQRFYQGQADQFKAAAAKVMEEKAADDAFQTSAKEVETRLFDDLKSTGRFTDDVNTAYATLARDFYVATAARLGITPTEMFARYPLKVAVDRITGEQRMEQGGAEESIRTAFEAVPSVSLGTAYPITVEFNGRKQQFMARQDALKGRNPRAALHLTHVKRGRMIAGGAEQWIAQEYKLDSKNNLKPNGMPKPLSDEEAAQFSANFPQPNPLQRFAQGIAKALGLQAEQPQPAAPVDDGVAPLDMGQFFQGQGNRAEISFAKDITTTPSVITLFKNADLSSFLHEMGHFQLEVLAHIASQPNAPAEIVQDLDAVFKWFGITGGEVAYLSAQDKQNGAALADMAAGFKMTPRALVESWKVKAPRPNTTQGVLWAKLEGIPEAALFAAENPGADALKGEANRPPLEVWQAMSLEEKRPYHEQFARGFEAYLFEGRAPSAELNGLFSRFRAWLINVYKSVKALNVEISDDIRGVFDRLVATDEAIKQAEAARGYAPLFPDDAEMQAMGAQATQDAVDELQRRGLRDMRWLSNARGRILKQLQADARAKRQAVEDEVRAEVRALPVYAAQRFLRYGEIDGEQVEGAKLDLAALKEMYGEEANAPWRYLPTGKAGLAGNEGLHPDVAAEMFGFTSGDQLVREILAATREAEMIEGMTDQRVLERYGDLSSPDALARAADEAIHNEARARFVATELKAVSQAAGPVRAITAAAKAFAETLVARKKVKDIKPRQHAAAETRAAKAAEKAMTEGDTLAAATEKRNQLVQNYATRVSYDALTEIKNTRSFFTRVVTGANDDVVKTRDLDMVNAARAVLANYGFGRKAKNAAEYLKAVQAYDPEMYAVFKDSIETAERAGKPFEELTLEEMRGLRDEIGSVWHLAKRSRQMEVDGDLLDRQEVQAELRARMEEIGVPDRAPGEGSAITPSEARLRKLQTVRAAARRVESWVEAKDGSNPQGPFRKYVWQTIKDAADNYRVDKAKYFKLVRDALETTPGLKRGLIDAPEIGYTFGKDEGGVGMSELLHALLHTGNESNKRKLLLGRGWATENADGSLDTARWDGFLARLHNEGRLTKEHYDTVQALWDTFEATKPLAQKTHRDVFGRYFDEVTAAPVETPFGTYRGGYAPAIVDSRIVPEGDLRALAEAENESLAYAFPTTPKGFTRARTEYNKPLLLDLRTVVQHVDKVLRFAHLEQPVRDVRRVLTAKEVSYALARIDPAAISGLLTPWLNRTAKQQVETPVVGDGGAMRFFSVLRQRAGMAAMFANVSNTAQQITGLSIAAIKVKPKYLLAAAAQYAKAPKIFVQTVADASPYMVTRLDNEAAQMTDTIRQILLDPTVYESAKAWTAKHTYFLQSAVDNALSPIVWTGAYTEAIETLPAELTDEAREKAARRIADGVVRQTQGATQPEEVSRIETGNAAIRLFTQFAGYFNMQANVLGTAYAQTLQEFGVRKGAGRMLYITLLGFLAPAWVAEAIAQAFRGGPDDEDDDGYLDDWLMAVFGFGTLRNATAMIPVGGQAVNAVFNAANSKPYDDRIGTSPSVSMMESAVRAPVSVYKAIVDDGSAQKAVRDVATLITLTTGLPASTVARPLGYLTGVSADEIEPTGPVDAVRGTVTGAKGPPKD